MNASRYGTRHTILGLAAAGALVLAACGGGASAPAASPAAQPAAPAPAAPAPAGPIVSAVPTAPEREGWPGLVFVAGGESNKMWVLDSRHHKLVTALDMGGPLVERTDPTRYPNLRDDHAMVFNKDFSVLYTVNSWEYEQSWVIKIDPKTFRELGRAPAGEGGHHSALSPDDKYLYVANQYATTVSVFEADTLEKIKELEVGLGADYISPSMYWDGKAIDSPYLFVSVDKEDKVVAIDWRTNEVAKVIPVGGALHGVNLTPDGKQVWAAVGGIKQAVVIDVATLSIVKTLPYFEKGGPTHIVFTPNGKSAFITGGGFLQKIDTSDYRVVWTAGGSGAHLGVSPDGKEVWTLNHTFDQGDRYPYVLGEQTLSAARVFDTETGNFTAEMIFERRPHEVQFVPYAAVGQPKAAPQAAVATTSDARPVTLVGVDDVFKPDAVTLKAGEKIQWVLENQDGYLHVLGDRQKRIETISMPGNTTVTKEWTANLDPGKYTFECGLHPGMQVDVTVEPAEGHTSGH